MSESSSLSLSDIKLLMENYQNMIQLNTILLEQQKQLIELQHQVLKKQDLIISGQNTTIEKLNSIVNKLENCTKNLQEINQEIKESYSNIGHDMTSQFQKTEDKDTDWKLDVVKQHSGINRNIYIAWGGMVAIILGLISLLVNTYEKFSVLENINELLDKLISYFKLG